MLNLNNIKIKFIIDKLLYYIIPVSLFFTILISCEISDFQDEVVEKDYSYDSLWMLNVKNDVHVVLIQDSLQFIRMIAPEGMQNDIEPEIENDTIILENKNRSKIFNRYSEEVKAEVHFNDCKVIFYQGSGNISSPDTLKLQKLSIWSNGATGKVELNVKNEYLSFSLSTGNLDVTIYGETTNLNIWTTSYAYVDLLNLKANKVNVRNNSPMDCYINVSDELDARVEYSGNIYYKGNPEQTEIFETGSGSVLKIN